MRVNQPFIPFIHHIWGETVPWSTVFIIQASDRMQYFTILQHKLHSFNIQDDRSTRGLLAKPLKNFQNHIYGQPVLTFAVWAVANVWTNILELSSNIIKKLLCLFFYLMVYRCVIFNSVWYARHFEYSCKRCSLNDSKQTAERLKLQKRLPTINKRNIIRWNIYSDNIFHSRRQVSKCL